MRILARIYGLGVATILCVAIFCQLMVYNVKYDELTSCISTAMSSTQIVMQENIEDRVYGTNARRKTIDSNDAYVAEFTENFNKLVNTNSEFKVKVYGVDYTKGFIDIGVDSKFKLLNGEYKTISSRKTSIVDVIETEPGGN